MSRSPSFNRNERDRFDDGYRLHIADLSVDCSQRDIERCFERFGHVIEVWHARSSCFCFVVFKHFEDGEKAMKEMHGRKLGNSRIRVTWAKPRARSRRRRWDPTMRCYVCGARGHFSRDCNDRNGSWRRRSRSRSYRRRSYESDRYGSRRSYDRFSSVAITDDDLCSLMFEDE